MSRQSAAACFALAALAACRPSAEGRCGKDADCRTGAFCSPEGICLALPPSVSVSITTPPDGAGWYSRSGAALDLSAQVTRDGTDPVSAVLTVPGCAAASCSFLGTAVTGGFRFRVTRDVQAVGSAALLPFQVVVNDRAGNQGVANGVLQIDDAPPTILSYAPVVAGTVGEDLQPWFAGGPGAPPIELAVRASDPGAGVASIALHVDGLDVTNGTPLDPAPTAAPDGSVHFLLPASGAFKEGPLHFQLVATDLLGHASSAPAAFILVDAAPPAVTKAAVNYAGVQPAGVCDASATCGRQGGTRLLRDDTADLAFDVTDCGTGTDSAAVQVPLPNAKTVAAVEVGSDPSACPNGNRTHHFKASVNFGDAVPSLPASDSQGNVFLPVNAAGTDRVGNAGVAAAAGGATGGDGIAALSLWRWRQKIAGPSGSPASPTGAPVLLPGNNGRVAIGMRNPASSPTDSVTALTAFGKQAWSQSISAGVGADLAFGSTSLNVYAVSPATSCSSSCSGTLTIIPPAGTSPTSCTQLSSVALGAPVAMTTATVSGAPVEVAVAVATVRKVLFNPNNLFVYQANCTVSSFQYLINGSSELTGVSALPGKVVLASAATFTSIDQNGGTGFNFGSAATYSGSVSLLDAPALISGAPLNAFFGTSTGDLHRVTSSTPCSGSGCWSDAYTTPWPHSPGTLSSAPVFDGTHIYTADDAGNVSSWLQSTGTGEWSQALGVVLSGPVILQGGAGSVLVVQKDGAVKVVSKTNVVSLLNVGAYGGAPPVPALEASGSYGIAYVPDGSGWVWAVNLPAPPMQASSAAWPRPGRDSCNSRSAGAACP